MNKRAQIAAAAILFALAGWFTYRFWRDHHEPVPMVYFYDLSERKLFAAPQDSVPPIPGTDGKEQDAVRAVVYSPTGDCARDQKIAYLEKYSTELKAQFEHAKASPSEEFPRLSRAAAQSHTFVARVNELAWHPMDSEEASRIIGEWRLANPDTEPLICIP